MIFGMAVSSTSGNRCRRNFFIRGVFRCGCRLRLLCFRLFLGLGASGLCFRLFFGPGALRLYFRLFFGPGALRLCFRLFFGLGASEAVLPPLSRRQRQSPDCSRRPYPPYPALFPLQGPRWSRQHCLIQYLCFELLDLVTCLAAFQPYGWFIRETDENFRCIL